MLVKGGSGNKKPTIYSLFRILKTQYASDRRSIPGKALNLSTEFSRPRLIQMLAKGGSGNKKPPIYSLFRTLKTQHASDNSACHNNSVERISKLVETQCKSKTLKLDQALGYFDSMVAMRPMPSVVVFNQLLGALSNMNQCSRVVCMYRQLMGLDDFRPGISTLTVVIKCLFRLRKAGLGLSVWGTIIKSGIMPDAYALCTLIHGFCAEGLMAAATELLREIVERRYPCNEVTYATVINGFCKAGEISKALEMLEKMGSNGGVRPSVGCFNPVIDGLFKRGRVEEALRLFQDMIGRGVSPDVFSYTSLFNGLCKSGRWEEARSFLMDMIDRGISPNVRTYSSLIHYLCMEGKTREAILAFEFMKENKVKPDVVTFRSLVSALCKSGQWKEVTRFLGEMADYRLTPDTVIFNIMLDARCKEGSDVEAIQLVEVMSDKGLFPNVVTYGLLLTGLCHSGKLEEARKLFDEMASQNVFPDVMTLNIVLNTLSSQGMMERARSVVEAMVEHGKELDTVTYNTLIKGYCLQGEMDTAKEVFDQMAELGVSHDTYSYNTMANGYVKVKRIYVAVKLLKDLIVNGLQPDQVTRNIMKNIHACKLELSLDASQQDLRQNAQVQIFTSYFLCLPEPDSSTKTSRWCRSDRKCHFSMLNSIFSTSQHTVCLVNLVEYQFNGQSQWIHQSIVSMKPSSPTPNDRSVDFLRFYFVNFGILEKLRKNLKRTDIPLEIISTQTGESEGTCWKRLVVKGLLLQYRDRATILPTETHEIRLF